MKTWQRVVLFVLVYIAVLTLPWWLSAVLLAGLTVFVPMYVEALFFGFLFDTLYASKFSFPYLALSIAFCLLVIVTFARPYVRTEQNQTYL